MIFKLEIAEDILDFLNKTKDWNESQYKRSSVCMYVCVCEWKTPSFGRMWRHVTEKPFINN